MKIPDGLFIPMLAMTNLYYDSDLGWVLGDLTPNLRAAERLPSWDPALIHRFAAEKLEQIWWNDYKAHGVEPPPYHAPKQSKRRKAVPKPKREPISEFRI